MTLSAEAMLALAKKQSDEIKEGMIAITLAWSTLETHMLLLLHACTGNGSALPVVSAIYYAATGLDARLAMTKAAILTTVYEFSSDDELFNAIEKIFNKISQKKMIRNYVAHGSISASSIKSGISHMRLTGPIFNFALSRKEMNIDISQEGAAAFRNIQYPGYSGNDLQLSAKSMERLWDRVTCLTTLAQSWRATGDTKACAEIIQRLNILGSHPL